HRNLLSFPTRRSSDLLARLAIIKNGHFPEITVWNQVKKIEPEIHKLYEELVNSEEGLEKRLELLFLASDVLIHSYIEYGTSHLRSEEHTSELQSRENI